MSEKMKAFGFNPLPSQPRPLPPPCPPLVMGHVTPASGTEISKPGAALRVRTFGISPEIQKRIAQNLGTGTDEPQDELTKARKEAAINAIRAEAWKAMAERLAEPLRHIRGAYGHDGMDECECWRCEPLRRFDALKRSDP